jgi:hypothetical protein
MCVSFRDTDNVTNEPCDVFFCSPLLPRKHYPFVCLLVSAALMLVVLFVISLATIFPSVWVDRFQQDLGELKSPRNHRS